MAKLKPLDFIAGMMQNKTEFDFTNPEIYSAYDTHMINRWLSMCDLYLPTIAQLNKRELPKETHYQFLKELLPQKKVFFTYIKKPRDLTQEQKVMVAKHFRTNLKNAEPMINLLSEEELNKIINIEKEII